VRPERGELFHPERGDPAQLGELGRLGVGVEEIEVGADLVLDLVVAGKLAVAGIAAEVARGAPLGGPYSMPSSTMSRAAATAIAALWVLAIEDSRQQGRDRGGRAVRSGNVDASHPRDDRRRPADDVSRAGPLLEALGRRQHDGELRRLLRAQRRRRRRNSAAPPPSRRTRLRPTRPR
jgi:hypothetical protein